MFSYVIFVLLSGIILLADCKHSCEKGYTHCGDDKCCCQASRAFCKGWGKKLEYIPTLPDDISELTFQNNFMPSIDRSAFDNISHLLLTHLHLISNKIENISADAFSGFKILRVLSLDNNKINQVQLSEALGSIQKRDKVTINLRNIGLTELNGDLVQKLANLTVSNLNIDNNQLTRLDFTTLEALMSLETFSAKDNLIRGIYSDTGHKVLSKITLSGNEMARYTPNFCSNNKSEDLFPRLLHLDISGNFISELKSNYLACLRRLEILQLSGNVIRKIPTNTFAELSSLRKLYLGGMSGNVKEIEKYAFNNSRLERINIQDNSIAFKSKNSDGIFQGCGHVTTLIISGNSFKYLTEEAMVRMFSPLKNLEQLTATNCNIKKLPAGLLESLRRLNTLILDQNRIEELDGSLTYDSGLTKLSLQSNKIRVLQKASFPENMPPVLKQLNLALNPFDCTCEMLWFRSAIGDEGKLGNASLINWPKLYSCVTPSSKNHTRFIDYRPTEIACKNVLLISALCMASFAIVLAIIASLSCRYKWYIALWCYKIKRRRRKNDRQPLLDTESGQFHGYVIYSSDDGQFVHHELRTIVEEKMSYKLKIWERDASVGGSELEEMVDSIYDSENVIAVISKSSLKDDKVRFQINVALDRQVELKRDFLMLVLLEDIEFKTLTKYWCVMFTKLPSARWCADETNVKRNVFDQQLMQHFETPTNNAVT